MNEEKAKKKLKIKNKMNLDYLPPEDVVDNNAYKVIVHKAKLRKKPKCVHAYWTCRCSICNQLLGSEKKPDIILNILKEKS